MAKSRVIHVRVDEDLLARLRREAKADGRTLSGWAARTLAAAVANKTKALH